MAAYGGAMAISSVPSAISMMVSVSAALRPARSPYAPSISAPRGRTTKPSPKARNEAISCTVGSSLWKKFCPMYTANSA